MIHNDPLLRPIFTPILPVNNPPEGNITIEEKQEIQSENDEKKTDGWPNTPFGD